MGNKGKIKISISTRFSIIILLIVGFFFIATFVVFIKRTGQSIQSQTVAKATSMLKTSNLEIEKVLLQVEQIPNNFQQLVVSGYIREDSLYAITRQIINDNPLISGCAIAFEPNYYKDRGYYFSPYSCRIGNDSINTIQLGNVNYDYFSMDWYLIPKLLKKPYWTEPYFDEGGGGMIMTTYSVPMFDKDSNFIGVFTSDISLNWFSDLVNSVKAVPGAYTFVVGRGGVYIIHFLKDRILNESIFSMSIEKNNPEIRTIGQAMVDGKSGDTIINIDDVKSYVFYAPIPRINWSIAMVCPYDSVFSELAHTTKVLFYIGVIALLLIFVLCFLVIKKLIRPVVLFARSADEIASGNLNAELPVIKSKDEMMLLREAFVNMQHDLEKYMDNLRVTASAKEKIESELRIARDIQMGMIPKIFPPYPDRNDIDLFAILMPAKEVGGDLYDFFIHEEKLYFTIGDVSGKGIPASLLMAVTRSLFRSVSTHLKTPSKIAFAINNAIAESNDSNMFVTMFIGILDLNTGKLRYTNAGHNPPVIISKNMPVMIPVDPNLPVGVLFGSNFSEQELMVESCSSLFFYTDGLTEAENKDCELYGEDRMMQCLQKVKVNTAKILVNDVLEDVHKHVADADQSDDLTILTVNYKMIKRINRTIIIDNNLEEIEKLHAFVEELARDIHFQDDLTMQLNLALEEIVANVILYAYKGESNKKIEIIADLDEDVLIFTVIDTGTPFDPTAKEDPDITLDAEDRPIGGLGVFIVKQLMDEVFYTRLNEQNVLKMKKKLNN